MPGEILNFLGMEAVIASKAMRALMRTVERVAKSSATILITGESGSGKEVVARAIHYYSARTHKPWVDLSCAALPEHLIESELFGYDKGAFSGADSAKPGLFELADTGTIFLDEIGELDPRMQVKLLRVLDAVPYYRLGGTKKISVDVRVVAATNRNLEASVAEGAFRSDLFHRLSQFTLCVPPLRERPEDIGALARHFLEQHDAGLRLDSYAIQRLENYSWPGNIRELRNAITRAALLAQDTIIRAEDLPIPTHSNGSHHQGAIGSDNPSLDGIEKRAILEALSFTGGHQTKAAARLGISRRTLSRKLKAYEAEGLEIAS
jgi:Nif-specific regulatory protein